MDGTTEDPTVAKSKGRLRLECPFILLVGLSIGIPRALGASWLTDGDVPFGQALVPVVLASVLVPLWTDWSNRKAARQ